MKIKNDVQWLSLPPFEINLSDFNILIGINGSGKSQFLNLLFKLFRNHSNQNYPVRTGIIHNDIYEPEEIALITNSWELNEFLPIDINDVHEVTKLVNALSEQFLEFLNHPDGYYFLGEIDTKSLLKDVLKYFKSKEIDINKDNFEKHLKGKLPVSPGEQLSNTKIGIRFYNYYIHHIESKIHQNEERFLEIYGPPPWDDINLIFNKIGLKISITSPNNVGLLNSFTPQFVNEKGIVIKVQDLSSGERVLVSLVLWIFNSEDLTTFPKILLLDEPDAHLHPEMVTKLLYVLYDVLYKKFNVKIVMTTHSPTTVALANEDCLYLVDNKKEGFEFITQIEKDNALEILTEFLPNLSIDYKNQKQVFCESPTDVKYYQSIHNKFIAEVSDCYKYYFIANSAGKGNCSQVYSIVDQIRGFGNSTSFGIVDFDKNNQPKNATKVHGINERWAVENFILDPFYIISLLYDLKKYKEVEQFGLGEHYNQFSIGNETNERLQEIADKYFSLFENKYQCYRIQKEKVKVEYHNGKAVIFPKWFLMEKSHGLEPKIKEVFEGLGSRFPSQTGADLQLATIDVLAKCYPFVPKTTVEFLKTLAD